jgi:hypothetical protein
VDRSPLPPFFRGYCGSCDGKELGASKAAAAPIVLVLVLESVGHARHDLTAYAHDTGRAKIKSQTARSIEDDDEDENDYLLSAICYPRSAAVAGITFPVWVTFSTR